MSRATLLAVLMTCSNTVAIVALVVVGCSKPAPPASAPSVYNELVEAGCIAPDDASYAAVQEGLQSDAQPPWFACLADGGTVAGCSVPCD